MVYVMRNGRRVIVALSFLLLCCGVHVHAQRVAVKTNALGWLTASPNVEAEFVLGSHVSLNMGIAANPISTDNFKTTFTHFQPEITDDDAVKEITGDGTKRELTLSDGSIRFDHVYFKYHPDSAEWNLTDIDFSIASGMTVGILGGT